MGRLKHTIRWFTRRDQNEREMEAELLHHLEQETALLVRRGMSEDEARRTAEMSLGKMPLLKEEMREARTGWRVESLLQDIRYGTRVLVRNPGFTLAAILILALGIGANTAMFSVVYGVLLRPLPYDQGEQLVVLHQKVPRGALPEIPFSAKEIFDYRDQNHTLQGVVEHHSMVFLLLANNSAERVGTAVVSANFFDVLGVKPLLGRTFVASDERHGAEAVLILSHKYWQTRHGGDRNIVGRVFEMNNRPHTVIGVLPPIPQYPVENDVYMPTSQCPTRASERFQSNRRARMMTAFGRLKPGVPLEQAQADLSTIASNLEKSYPDAYPKQNGYGISAVRLDDDLTRRAKKTFLVLLGASALVLLIACANVANLLLARLLKVERELAVRAALGASRLRLARQLLTESVLLSLAGGLLGLAVAPTAVRLLSQFASRFTTRATEVEIDTPVLLFTLLVSVGTGVLFGVAPALSWGRDVAEAIKSASSRSTSSRGRQRLRGALVVAQVTVSFTLLIGAGLMTRSLFRMLSENPGFKTERLLTMRVTPNFTRYNQPPQTKALLERVLQRTSEVAGVESVALATNFPFNPRGIANGPGATEFRIQGEPPAEGQAGPRVDTTVVSDRYFDTIGQRLLEGRSFSGQDDQGKPLVAIINQTMARHRWPNANPLGKRIAFGNNADLWIEIVGVVEDAKEYGLDRPVSDEVYLPLLQNPFAGNLVLRTRQEPGSMETAVRAALRDVDTQLAVDEVHPIERLKSESVASPRLMATLLGMFGVLALVISAGGIAAVMALAVNQRRHELGIRMALGARRDVLVRSIVMKGVALALLGTVLGIAASAGLTRVLSTFLYETSPTDAVTFAAVSAVFVLVAVVASAIPARQVTAIDPLIALRSE
jgi:predicted permease